VRLAIQARPGPTARQIPHCVCRRSASDSFLFFFRSSRSSLPGEDPAIHTAVKPAKRLPPSVCLPELSVDHRVKSGGDESESGVTVAWHSSGAETHRENEIARL
jgi:hypothetical protein